MDDTCFTPTDDADLRGPGPARLVGRSVGWSAGCCIRDARRGAAGGLSRCASRVGRVGARPGPDTCVCERVCVGYVRLYASYS